MIIGPGYRGFFTKVNNPKIRKKSSNQWISRQLNDFYVVQSKINGYRSRSAYKLIEINNKFQLLKPEIKIVDLGAAAGGWSQVLAKITRSHSSKTEFNNICAVDILDMKPIEGVTFLKGDFYEINTQNLIKKHFNFSKIDLIISDMAENTTGHQTTDHIRIIDLCEHALVFALEMLKDNGHFICKIFRGCSENSLIELLKNNFKTIKYFKPKSSRKESNECYLIALNKKI
ncbi:RlmE family RNA methyltransferase [Rickettsia endosymbiont of Cardiosporidium cionae]|uniref:RlmE family RNA methyltransferase n=1 Tax=Rickettsia endosymbiont of Cardiosporidium cionae TaxID=2777155 RepID=UPI001892F868|nr:RlmE family RNA methyltransferase [Rickettsia endosymbiont of Cardiosporidium cionae]KAF8818836.1 RlmE family RNA methyltransferase [Rickettsia endosymbiont of Cardiosporidium cionae]